ncbi:cytochrome-c peroxidase [Phenylobacterium sp.]|uniref:cytochrome-c peroxidase n=1 Tax=Phenylobacterium sp. TaxID=1871053 RepID=UPI0025E3CDF9|nr:cytochrome-c peroxidase [Phenylobacterium sp.]MBX3483224.1 di-heme enzyme [Phenylobacterium sp.]
MIPQAKIRGGLRILAAACAVAAGVVLGGLAAAPEPFDWRLPPGVAPPPVPADNPMSAAKVELGRRLFYDADLSIDGAISCATCHEQHHGFTDSNRTRPGVHGTPGRRNIMSLAGVGYLSPLTWADPRAATLEQQMLIPVLGESPVEMGMKGQEAELARRLAKDACYRRMFAEAFPDDRGEIGMATVAKALAAFQRTMLAFDTPYDRSRAGDWSGMDAAAQYGWALFNSERLKCATCHSGPAFSDSAYHALAGQAAADDTGLAEISGRAGDLARFRTPGLRNVAVSGPYLHDGAADTLAAAIRRHFAATDPNAPTAAEITDLSAFLRSLTDAGFLKDPRFALPQTACGEPL